MKFDNYTSRYKHKGNKADYTTPYYDPKYKIIERRRTKGTLDFAKIAGRKLSDARSYCNNTYDIDINNSAINPKLSIPNFKKMKGRNTLKSKVGKSNIQNFFKFL